MSSRKRVARRAPAAILAWALWAIPAAGGPGPLVVIGGALDPGNEAIYRAILERALPGAPICVLPTASGQPRRSMTGYVKDFNRYGGRGAGLGVPITAGRPRRAAAARLLERLADCGGFFFTGGDQSRIVDVLRPGGEPSPADAMLRERWRRGAVVAGTSAGAAMMSDPMIGGGSSTDAFEHGVTAEEDELGVWVRDGMGFLESALVDQHCLMRGRLGRLLVAVAARSEHRRGLCVDEDTAWVVEEDEATVVGAAGVAILDLEGARPAAGRGFRGGLLWLLGDGDRLVAGTGAHPEEGKREWSSPSPGIEPPADPWVQAAFYDALVGFAGSDAKSAALGSPPAAVRLRKGEGFRALSRKDEEPRALFAGPFEIDWLPAAGEEPP